MDAPLIDLHTRRVDFDVSVRAAKRPVWSRRREEESIHRGHNSCNYAIKHHAVTIRPKENRKQAKMTRVWNDRVKLRGRVRCSMYSFSSFERSNRKFNSLWILSALIYSGLIRSFFFQIKRYKDDKNIAQKIYTTIISKIKNFNKTNLIPSILPTCHVKQSRNRKNFKL